MKKYNILIFPAGSENGIDIFKSLRYNIHFNVYGASSRSDHAEFLYEKDNYIVDNLYIDDPMFIFSFNQIIEKFNIDFVFPTHDTIYMFLTKYRERINSSIIGSPYETALVANDKSLQYKFLKKYDFYPNIYSHDNLNDIKYPVFLKPFVAAGGKGTFLVNNQSELIDIMRNSKNLLISQFLPGEEITVDCFSKKNGELLFVGPRTRERITNGMSYRTRPIKVTKEILNVAEMLNSEFTFIGPWFFQLKKDDQGVYKLLEFSVRQAGTMTLYRHMGINFSALAVFDHLDFDIKIIYNEIDMILDRGLHNSFLINYDYNTVYIDFDDTLIINNKVNSSLMKYIYQCKNKKIKVILITKHIYEIVNSLNKYGICKELFDNIIHLKNYQNKWEFINPNKSIFIDNYFFERESVSQKIKIPVFDIDAIDCLIDDKHF